MSRVTPPVNKLRQLTLTPSIRRSISSSAKAAHPSPLLDSTRTSSAYLPRKLSDLKNECVRRDLLSSGSKAELITRLLANDQSRSAHTLTNSHRPVSSNPIRTIPLMQGFRNSAPLHTPAAQTSALDYYMLPNIPTPSNADSTISLRVPLLPDNYLTTHTSTLPESNDFDTALPGAEVHVIGAEEGDVVSERGVSVLTEVVGNEGLGEMDVASFIDNAAPSSRSQGSGGSFWSGVSGKKGDQSVFGELWNGIVEDVFGGAGKGVKSGVAV